MARARGVAAARRVLSLARVSPLRRPVRRPGLSPRYAKATADDLRAVVENFDEVRAWLRAAAPCLVGHLDAVAPGAVQRDDCRDAFGDAIAHRLATSTSWRHARNSEVMQLKVNRTGNVGWKRARAVTDTQFDFFKGQARNHNAGESDGAGPRAPNRRKKRVRLAAQTPPGPRKDP